MTRLQYDPTAPQRVTDAKAFGRVAVLLGGDSSERDISLLSGNAVLEALQRRGVDAHAFDPRDRALSDLPAERFDRVWIALHGPGGEDGTLQGALEYLGVPYTGSGVMGSAIGMDKLRTKRLAEAIGVATADYVVLRGPQDFEIAVERLGLPLIVKPATQGSSVGMTKVERAGDLPAAYQVACKFESGACEGNAGEDKAREDKAREDKIFAEPWITGKEYTVAVLQGRALPSIRIETPQTFYDYQAKYFRDDTRYFCPSGLSNQAEQHLAQLALAAFDAIGASGWGRADFMSDATGRPLLLEVNTVPGMTSHSLVPMAARAIEIDFDELVWRVLETSFTRRSVRPPSRAASGEGASHADTAARGSTQQ
jgi:D-alanine-D-alanine ligase